MLPYILSSTFSNLTLHIKMERFNISYSKKNIPLPSEKEYITQLVSKVENVTKRMRWKALQFLGKLETNNKKAFGFKSPKCSPAVDELAPFESDLQQMISSIKFRPIHNKFLTKMNEDIKNINST